MNKLFNIIFLCLSMCVCINTYADKQNIPTDTALYNKALAGDAEAQAVVGRLYNLGGDGVEKDVQEAFKWFCLSAKQKNPYGQYELGVCYDNGKGVKTNGAKAKKRRIGHFA